MANPSINLGNGNWSVKESKLLGSRPIKDKIAPIEFDVTRASTATRVNKQGLIETVNSNIARIDYSNDANGALLLENQSTNLVTYSESFDNAYWTKIGSSVTSGFASPIGDLSSFKLATDTSNGIHYITKTVTSSLGKKTFSFYVDYTKNDYVSCSMIYNTNSRGVGLIIDLKNDTIFDSVTSSTDYTLNIKTVGNFKRIELSAQNTVDDILDTIFISPYNGQGYTWNGAKRLPSYQGDGTSGVYIFGAQLEQNSFSTSYIPTSGTTQTRVAETCGGAGSSSSINSEEGVLYAEINSQTLSSGNDRVLSISDGTTNNRIFIGFRENAGGVIYSFVIVGGVIQANYNTNITSLNTYSKVCLKYKENDFSIYVNGFKVFEDTSGSVFPKETLSNLSFNQGINSNNFYGLVKQLKYYNTALTDSELQALTTL